MTAIDEGLLSPVTAGGLDAIVGDRAFLDALVFAEVALSRAYGAIGLAPAEVVAAIEEEFAGEEGVAASTGFEVRQVAEAAVSGGNPVIPIVGLLRARVPEQARTWVHRAATSQDMWDTAIMIVARRSVAEVRGLLSETMERLLVLAEGHRDDIAAARTLTQHAVPTTAGLRAATWARAIDRALMRLATLEFPAQLGGAGGTAASFVEVTGSSASAWELVAEFARCTKLSAPVAPWHVTRWPVTELADALVQAIDALGKFASDVVTLSRTEIAEVAVGAGGGSSAMPQKQNPTGAVLVRSAAIRAPQLAATLHLAAALAVDERPDGAWHAEWPTLRELMRLALGAAWHASTIAADLRVDGERAARNLEASHGLVVAERLALVLGPELGAAAVSKIVANVTAGEGLADSVRRAVASSGLDVDVDDLLDPARYTGLAADFVDDAVRTLGDGRVDPDDDGDDTEGGRD